MSIIVSKFQFPKRFRESDDPVENLWCLRLVGGISKLVTAEDIGKEVEEATSLTRSDLNHAFSIFFSRLRKFIVRGDRVRIPEIGTFYMTISSDTTESEDELSVRSIKKVNIRFLPDKALKLVNNALAPTRSDNNVSFEILGKKEASAAPSTPDDGGGDGGDDVVDPGA